MKTLTKIVLLAAIVAVCPNRADAQIAAWNFENNALAINNSPTPSSGSGTATSIGMNVYPTPVVGVTTCDVVMGAVGDTGANGNANLTQIWRVRAQGGGNGWSSMAPIGTQGAIFSASTVGFTGINVSFDWYATNQGEGHLQLAYTTNGTTFQNIPVNIGANAGVSLLVNAASPNTVLGPYLSFNAPPGGQEWFQGLTATIADPLAENNPLFAIAMLNASTGADCVNTLGTALNNSSGNWRFDNVSITGIAVPEPSSMILCGLAGGLGVFRRLRRKAS